MLWAELKGKLAMTASLALVDRWEDVLTSSVFGMLRYLPDDVLLAFLANAITVEGQRFRVDPRVSGVDLHFWPQLRGWTREPDVIVDLRREDRRLVQRVIVEAKYRSGKSQKEEDVAHEAEDRAISDQLADIVRLAYRNHASGAVAADLPPVVIYLTAHHVMPAAELRESVMAATPVLRGEAEAICWLGWSRCDAIIRSRLAGPEVPATQRRMMADLSALLERRDLAVFAGWPVMTEGLPLPTWRLGGEAIEAKRVEHAAVAVWGWPSEPWHPTTQWKLSLPQPAAWFQTRGEMTSSAWRVRA
jgi:hypothetical protein